MGVVSVAFAGRLGVGALIARMNKAIRKGPKAVRHTRISEAWPTSYRASSREQGGQKTAGHTHNGFDKSGFHVETYYT
jgi:hypothetical protein